MTTACDRAAKAEVMTATARSVRTRITGSPSQGMGSARTTAGERLRAPSGTRKTAAASCSRIPLDDSKFSRPPARWGVSRTRSYALATLRRDGNAPASVYASPPIDFDAVECRPMLGVHPSFVRRIALAILVAGLATGCVTRPEPIFEEGGIQVFLRSDVRWMRTVEKGYSHPVTIAPVRVAHILSRIDLKPPSGFLVSFEGDKERVPAIQTDALYTVAEGVSKALAAADPNQEVVVMVIRDTKKLGRLRPRLPDELRRVRARRAALRAHVAPRLGDPEDARGAHPRAADRRQPAAVQALRREPRWRSSPIRPSRSTGAIRCSRSPRARACCRAARSCAARC